MYTSYNNGERIRRDSDGATIPGDAGNRDRAEYQAWIALGNSPAIAPPPAPPGYRDRRQKAYIGLNTVDGLGVDDGDPIRTIGDVLDVVISELVARGPALTENFSAMISKITVIKQRYPKL